MARAYARVRAYLRPSMIAGHYHGWPRCAGRAIANGGKRLGCVGWLCWPRTKLALRARCRWEGYWPTGSVRWVADLWPATRVHFRVRCLTTASEPPCSAVWRLVLPWMRRLRHMEGGMCIILGD